MCRIRNETMEIKARFKVILSGEVIDFLKGLKPKVQDKIMYNIDKAASLIDPELFKKLDDTEIWEFRTRYERIQYRLLAFWDKTDGEDTLVIATHGFIKKTQKTPSKEITRAEDIRKMYYDNKQ